MLGLVILQKQSLKPYLQIYINLLVFLRGKKIPTVMKDCLHVPPQLSSTANTKSLQFSHICAFFASTLRRWDKSAAIQELFSFHGIGTKQKVVWAGRIVQN